MFLYSVLGGYLCILGVPIVQSCCSICWCGEWMRCDECRHVGGTRGSVIVSSATYVLWMSVVRGIKGVGGV